MIAAIERGGLSTDDFPMKRMPAFVSSLLKLLNKYIHNKDKTRLAHLLLRKKPTIAMKVRLPPCSREHIRGMINVLIRFYLLQPCYMKHLLAARGGDFSLEEVTPTATDYGIE